MNDENPAGASASRSGRSAVLPVLAAILLAQAALLVAALGFLIAGAASSQESTPGAGIVEIALVAIALVWIVASAVGLLRRAAWSRASIIAIEVLHAAVAVGMFQGAFAEPAWGLALLLPAVAALILVFTKPVLAATMRERATESD